MADFQRLDVYVCALDFLRWCSRVLPHMRKAPGDLIDQLQRAASSVPLNIAEATGRRGKDRIHHNRIACGSAKESAAILDVFVALNLLPEEETREGKVLVERMISMLTAMSQP